MRDHIQARAAQIKRVDAKEASIVETARQLTTAIAEAFSGLDVTGESRVVSLPSPKGKYAIPWSGRLSYLDGRVQVLYNQNGLAPQSEQRTGWDRLPLEKCPQNWLAMLLQAEVVGSLIDEIGGRDIDLREARADRILADVESVLSAEAVALDAEMETSISATGDENLARLWQDAIEATRNDTADALTRCSRFLEATCAKILREREIALPRDKSMQPLVKACLDTVTWPDVKEAEGDVRQLLGGIQSICNGIGALRTHFGTAHGASSHLPPLDPGYAVFVKQATVAAATFLLDRHQAGPLAAADDSSPAPGD
ncbi:TPA: abortive infection family protein [Burkholderia orbicola]|uniref:abortive infection family protein n=1 Tax=Burkholderia cenocepacia TaxID=95486 RepID=UPI000F59D60D|nr:abortive infection family protein [Burkholderia cenocepacia]MBR8155455.1 abortive infection family protein [Burkholderia cenocepacia]RQV16046.1 hypothetical protein DF030_31655 [Burkholderia cenocepacia]